MLRGLFILAATPCQHESYTGTGKGVGFVPGGQSKLGTSTTIHDKT